MMAHLAPRRAALSGLGMGPIAEATADMLAAVAASPDEGYPLSELAETAGTRFGIDVQGVRIDGVVISDRALKLDAGTFVLQVGKRKFARVTLTA